jgi:phosphoribosylformimino-5-aminoimidazole carboxamide ribotide isomerase
LFLFPAIDMRNGQVVRLHQGRYDEQTTYSDNPLKQAHVFADAGATWLHVVDLDGARTGRLTHIDHIKRICAETSLKVEVGGGVRTESVIDKLLDGGVERVVLGTAALENWAWFERLMGNPTYRGRLVLGLDARQGKVATRGWENQLDSDAETIAKTVSDWPLAAIVYTDIATDGTLKGPNVEATRKVAEATLTPVVASGGVGRLEDLIALKKLPVQGAIVGRALYDGAFTIDEALAAFEGSGTSEANKPQ